MRSLNHAFFPGGGGLDLTGAAQSTEGGCIELHFGGQVEVVKPQKLTFDSFGDNLEWAYFRLETGEIEPSGVYENNSFEYEELTEINPGEYLPRSIWEHGYYGYDENGYEMPLPKGARVISRCFKGAYVIFAKTSIYNQVPGTYDGRHNKMSSERFRNYIAKSALEDSKKNNNQ